MMMQFFSSSVIILIGQSQFKYCVDCQTTYKAQFAWQNQQSLMDKPSLIGQTRANLGLGMATPMQCIPPSTMIH